VIKVKRYLAIFIIALVVLGMTIRAFCYEAEVTEGRRNFSLPSGVG